MGPVALMQSCLICPQNAHFFGNDKGGRPSLVCDSAPVTFQRHLRPRPESLLVGYYFLNNQPFQLPMPLLHETIFHKHLGKDIEMTTFALRN
jgi:hypothetical protein